MSHYNLLCNDSHPPAHPEDIANVVPQLRTGPIDGGDICAVSASVQHPFLALLVQDERSGTICTQETRDTLDFLQRHPEAGKTRPCLVVNNRNFDDPIPADPKDDPWRAKICLMGTFEHSNISDFSEVHQHFLLPISPTVGLNSAHFHTNPDWICKGPQWIVAYPLTLPLGRTLTQRWRHTPNPRQAHGSYFVPREALDDFNEFCRIAYRTWGEKSILYKQKAQADILASRSRSSAAASILSRKSGILVGRSRKSPISILKTLKSSTIDKNMGTAMRALANLNLNTSEGNHTPSTKTSSEKASNWSNRSVLSTASKNRFDVLTQEIRI